MLRRKLTQLGGRGRVSNSPELLLLPIHLPSLPALTSSLRRHFGNVGTSLPPFCSMETFSRSLSPRPGNVSSVLSRPSSGSLSYLCVSAHTPPPTPPPPSPGSFLIFNHRFPGFSFAPRPSQPPFRSCLLTPPCAHTPVCV